MWSVVEYRFLWHCVRRVVFGQTGMEGTHTSWWKKITVMWLKKQIIHFEGNCCGLTYTQTYINTNKTVLGEVVKEDERRDRNNRFKNHTHTKSLVTCEQSMADGVHNVSNNLFRFVTGFRYWTEKTTSIENRLHIQSLSVGLSTVFILRFSKINKFVKKTSERKRSQKSYWNRRIRKKGIGNIGITRFDAWLIEISKIRPNHRSSLKQQESGSNRTEM